MGSSSWSDLPAELLEIIIKLLAEDSIDRLSPCEAVCQSWRYAVKNMFLQLIPLFFVSSGQITGLVCQGFLNPVTGSYKQYKNFPRVACHHKANKFPFGIWDSMGLDKTISSVLMSDSDTRQDERRFLSRPMPRFGLGTKVVASSREWLLLITNVATITDSGGVYGCSLFNPLLKDQVELPMIKFKIYPLLSSESYSNCWGKTRFTMSTKPYTVLALLHDMLTLAFWKQGGKQWSVVYLESKFHDVLFYKTEFYAIDEHLNFMKLEFCVPNLRAENKVSWTDTEEIGRVDLAAGYLVVSYSGDLLFLLAKMRKERGPGWTRRMMTTDFVVYKMNWREREWVKMTSLDDEALFLGKNSQAICVSIGKSTRYKKNHIYFSFDKEDFGLYDYKRSETCKISAHSLSATQLWCRPEI